MSLWDTQKKRAVGESDDEDGDNTPAAVAPPPLCGVCQTAVSKYSCPKCSQRTCSLACAKAHKQDETVCDGKRTGEAQFLLLSQMDDNTLRSDFNFLESVILQVDGCKRKRDNEEAASKFNQVQQKAVRMQLRKLCLQRNIDLRLVAYGMSLHVANTTRFTKKSKRIYWRIEWNFLALQKLVTSPRCSDVVTWKDCLLAFLHQQWPSFTEINSARNKALSPMLAKKKQQTTVEMEVEGAGAKPEATGGNSSELARAPTIETNIDFEIPAPRKTATSTAVTDVGVATAASPVSTLGSPSKGGNKNKRNKKNHLANQDMHRMIQGTGGGEEAGPTQMESARRGLYEGNLAVLAHQLALFRPHLSLPLRSSSSSSSVASPSPANYPTSPLSIPAAAAPTAVCSPPSVEDLVLIMRAPPRPPPSSSAASTSSSPSPPPSDSYYYFDLNATIGDSLTGTSFDEFPHIIVLLPKQSSSSSSSSTTTTSSSSSSSISSSGGNNASVWWSEYPPCEKNVPASQ